MVVKSVYDEVVKPRLDRCFFFFFFFFFFIAVRVIKAVINGDEGINIVANCVSQWAKRSGNPLSGSANDFDTGTIM